MIRIRPATAVAAIAALAATILVAAVPATAAPASGVTSIDFEGADFAPWVASGATITIVEDSADSSNHVGAVTERGADTWRGISSATGAYEEGVAYTFSAKVRVSEASSVRFIANEPGASNEYVWVGNTTGVVGEWVTISGTHTFGAGAADAKVSIEVSTPANYDVDDISVTGDSLECEPETATRESVNFEGADFAPWVASGATITSVEDSADSSNHVGAVTERGADTWRGISSATGAYEEGVAYTFSAKVRVSEASSVRFIANEPGASNEYVWVGNTTGVVGEWVTISGTHTFGAGAADAKVSIEVSTPANYDVDDISVTYMTTCDDGPEPGTVALATDFETDLGGWVKRDNGTGDFTLERTDTVAHGGSYSAMLSERVSQGNGLGHDVTTLLEPGATYELTAWVRLSNASSDELWLSLQSQSGEADPSFSTLAQFTGLAGGDWKQVTASFTAPAADSLFIYFETPYESGDAGDTTDFAVDDISIVVPEPPVVQDLTPVKDTVDFPFGVAIDQRETLGAPSELLLKHFDQITPENYMKPEAWYDAEGNWNPNSAQIDSLMDFAQDNDIRLYGHVLVWHSQTPAWFFQDEEGNPLTSSDADKQILRDRMRTHINNVAEYLAQWGDFGDGNPLVAFDVVNEVIDDSAAYTDGMRRSEWYRILGEEFVADAFTYAEEAFNGTYAADGVDRPVTLFINDYNTEQSGKRGRYLALVDRLLAADVPVDGIGHQFHVSLSQPVSTLDEALDDASGRGLSQAVTEFDVTTGVPESTAKFIDQGYYYRDAFEIFREHAEEMFSVTVWGLNDARSWRDSSGGPLVFNDGFQAKPAYYGIVEPSGEEDPLPARLRTANSFAGSVDATSDGVASGEWELLPLLPAGENAQFQTRWASDHLSVFVTVDDATDDESDAVEVQVGDTTYSLTRDGVSTVPAFVVERDGGYDAVLQVPLTEATEGQTIDVDVRTTDDDDTGGWNTPGVLGTVTLVEPLSHVNIPEALTVPTIDGTKDDVWSTSSAVQATKYSSGTSGALGTFNLLWSDQKLYVYAEVADPTVDVSGSDPWVQDSVEIYVDPGNAKNGSYRYDDTQIRINADGAVSFGTGDEGFQAARVTSVAERVEGGYVIEASISLLEYGGLGSIQGLDVQVNDASGGARTAIRNWADPTGAGYQSTARWGVATLVAGTVIDQAAFTPVIKGAAVVGTTLKVSGLPTGSTLTYRWLRNGVAISGATGSTYKATTSDAGKRLSVAVTSVRSGYADRTETSAVTTPVLRVFSKVTTPKIVGTVAVGRTLKASIAQWSPTASFKYQWYSNGKAISGANKSTLTLSRWHAGHTITVKVTGSRSGYLPVVKSSAGKKVPLLNFTVGHSRLNGPTRFGGTLVVTPGASRPVATVKSYQWYANGKAISGATKSKYTVTAKEVGKQLTCKVTYRATGYNTKSVIVGPTYRITWR